VVHGGPGEVYRAFWDRIRAGPWSMISGIGYAGPPEDEAVVILGDLAHGLPEVGGPHTLVCDEREVLDQGFEEDLAGRVTKRRA